ncbi:MAG: hypothetical protein ABIL09_00280, partial [Gemmatimonadota bacterium]
MTRRRRSLALPAMPPLDRAILLALVALAGTALLVLAPVPVAGSDLFDVGAPSRVAGGGLGEGGPATATSVLPTDVLAAPDGSFYIADEQFNRVRLVAPDGAIRTVVGSGLYGFNGSGRFALKSALGIANSLALGPDGNLWLVDLASQQIRFVDGNGALRTFASPASPLFASVSGPFAPNGIDVVADGRV